MAAPAPAAAAAPAPAPAPPLNPLVAPLILPYPNKALEQLRRTLWGQRNYPHQFATQVTVQVPPLDGSDDPATPFQFIYLDFVPPHSQSKLMVRDDYKRLAARFDAKFKKRDFGGYVVLGQPGQGTCITFSLHKSHPLRDCVKGKLGFCTSTYATCSSTPRRPSFSSRTSSS